MASIATRHGSTYECLRAAYDNAFQNFAREIGNLQELEATSGVENKRFRELEEETARASELYLRTRNDVADYLLRRQSAKRTAKVADECSSGSGAWDRLQMYAYFLWTKADKPGSISAGC